MRSFWENRAQETQARARSLDENVRRNSLQSSTRSRSGAGYAFDFGGGANSNTTAAHFSSIHSSSMRRLRSDMERMCKLQEEVDSKIQAIPGTSDGAMTHRSSGSDSEGTTVPTPADYGDLGDEEIASLCFFEETSRSLWRAQRSTVRLLLRYLDKNQARLQHNAMHGHDGGNQGSMKLALEPQEPAGEPDAGEPSPA